LEKEVEKLKKAIKKKEEEIVGLKEEIKKSKEKGSDEEKNIHVKDKKELLRDVSKLIESGFGLFNLSKRNKPGRIETNLLELLEDLEKLSEKTDSFKKEFEVNGKKGIIDFKINYGTLSKSRVGRKSLHDLKRKRETSKRFKDLSRYIKRDKEREPISDIFEEENTIKIVIELPGVSEDDIKWELTDDKLRVNVDNPDKRYSKNIKLPSPVNKQKTEATYKNGILEFSLKKTR